MTHTSQYITNQNVMPNPNIIKSQPQRHHQSMKDFKANFTNQVNYSNLICFLSTNYYNYSQNL